MLFFSVVFWHGFITILTRLASFFVYSSAIEWSLCWFYASDCSLSLGVEMFFLLTCKKSAVVLHFR